MKKLAFLLRIMQRLEFSLEDLILNLGLSEEMRPFVETAYGHLKMLGISHLHSLLFKKNNVAWKNMIILKHFYFSN